jgi:hypothetical protein
MDRRLIAPVIAFTSLVATTSHGQLATWEWVARQTTDIDILNIPGAVWLPNSFSNGAIDDTGRCYFSAKIYVDASSTSANQGVQVAGVPGNVRLIARNGSPVLAGGPAGAVYNTSTGINGLQTANTVSANGWNLIAGTMNGGGVTTTGSTYPGGANNTAQWLVNPAGTAYLIARQGDLVAPGVNAYMSDTKSVVSQLRAGNSGRIVNQTALAGGDTVTSGTAANNSAYMFAGIQGKEVIIRKGDLVPVQGTITDGTRISPDSYQNNFNSNGDYVGTGTLVVGTGTTPVTTSNDKCIIIKKYGQPVQVVAREGDPVPGIPADVFAASASLSLFPRPMDSTGRFLFVGTFTGPDVTTGVNDIGVFMWDPAVGASLVVRKGDASSALGGETIGAIQTSTSPMVNNAGKATMCFYHGTGNAKCAVVVYDMAARTFTKAFDSGDQIPGLVSGDVIADSYAGGMSMAFNNLNQIVVKLGITGPDVVSGTNSDVLLSWTASTGLRLLMRTGDTNLSGYAIKSFYPLGGTGQNADGGNSWFGDSGWFVTNYSDANPNGASSTDYAIIRTKVTSSAPCPADLNHDGQVNGGDLGVLLGAWGACSGCAADLNADGVVNGADLGIMLAAWGACP